MVRASRQSSQPRHAEEQPAPTNWCACHSYLLTGSCHMMYLEKYVHSFCVRPRQHVFACLEGLLHVVCIALPASKISVCIKYVLRPVRRGVLCAVGQQGEARSRQSASHPHHLDAIFQDQQSARRPKALFLDACGTFLIPSESVTAVYRRYAKLNDVPVDHLADSHILEVHPSYPCYYSPSFQLTVAVLHCNRVC